MLGDGWVGRDESWWWDEEKAVWKMQGAEESRGGRCGLLENRKLLRLLTG
jgi:hypothetical protein